MAATRKSFRAESVTYVSGTNCYPSVRSGQGFFRHKEIYRSDPGSKPEGEPAETGFPEHRPDESPSVRDRNNPADPLQAFNIHLPRQAMIFFLTAYNTSSAVLCRFSFCMRLLRWLSTVYGLSCKLAATSLLEFPSASNCSTSRSRSVSSA